VYKFFCQTSYDLQAKKDKENTKQQEQHQQQL